MEQERRLRAMQLGQEVRGAYARMLLLQRAYEVLHGEREEEPLPGAEPLVKRAAPRNRRERREAAQAQCGKWSGIGQRKKQRGQAKKGRSFKARRRGG